MTIPQEQHLQNIKDRFEQEVDAKYRAGQQEHGGNLFDMDASRLLKEIKAECIDLYVYVHCLEEKLRESA